MRPPVRLAAFFAALLSIPAALNAPRAEAFAKPRPKDDGRPKALMISMGDSLTVGAMSDTSLPKQADDVTSLSIEPGTRAYPLVLPKGISESQIKTSDVEAKMIWDNKHTYSWATGSRVFGHAPRLVSHSFGSSSPIALEAKNFAVNGSRVSSMIGQAKKVLREAQSGKYTHVEYVTMLIGANDVCAKGGTEGTPGEKMRDSYFATLDILASIPQAQPIKILMTTILPAYELGKPEIRNARSIFGMKCSKLRDGLFQYCNRLTTWNDEAGRLKAKDLVDRRNIMIREVVAEAKVRYAGRLDIHLADAWDRVALTRDLLSLDCFHPNATGQRLISGLMWLEQPWYLPPPSGALRPVVLDHP